MSSYFEPCLSAAQAAAIANIANGTTSIPVVRPDLGEVLVALGAAAWTYGAWIQVAAPNDLAGHMLIGLDSASNTPNATQFQVGVGAAGAEVVVANVPIRVAQVVGVVPAVIIPANARVALRGAGAGGAGNVLCRLWFIPRPLA